jgi:hypothetical protein
LRDFDPANDRFGSRPVFGDVRSMSGLPGSGHGWAIEQRCAVLLLILSMTLIGLYASTPRGEGGAGFLKFKTK